MLDKKRYALQGFYEGKNCAQSVIMAYANEFDMDTKQALKLAQGFGGGIGKMQKTCGAASGAYMLIGMRNSAHIDNEHIQQSTTTEMIQLFNKEFIRINGSDQCNKLLNIDLKTEEGQASFKAKDMKKEICSKCVTSAIDILEDLFQTHKN
ncbi:C-GCAxxG-C-C family protein [Carboxylicivirga sp. N1Y90]|uniref:C-GCAxxG-C-C family protein n=1 Tax=Carboxylicivirga fragile TaxID=3417571 RepID=UPI003D345FEE|nr:C_GCAxxG_C_C family protein [Marinilabiliaceae bacterium N1Y90]